MDLSDRVCPVDLTAQVYRKDSPSALRLGAIGGLGLYRGS